MGTHQDAVQGAVVGAVAVVSALLHGALDALIGIFVHFDLPPSFEIRLSMRSETGMKHGKVLQW